MSETPTAPRMSATETLQRWICESCGYIYDPDEGDPDGGIPAGTAFEEIPDTWFCPVCGARKRDFDVCTRTDLSDWEQLLALDRERVWHPYGALPAALASLPVVSAEGVRLKLADGRELIDGMSSWWCAIHGYRHPALDEAVTEQLGRMAHVMFGGLTHEPAVRLAERLIELAPAGLERVFFADSGSVAVEVAIKMALQYQRARGHAGRTRLLTVRGGYHGDTFGAMAVCDPVGGHAQPVRRRAARSTCSPSAARTASMRAGRGLGGAGERAGGAARGRAGRGDRRARRAGRGRDALPLARVRGAAARSVRRARAAAGAR